VARWLGIESKLFNTNASGTFLNPPWTRLGRTTGFFRVWKTLALRALFA
jgi:hypothetical protein